MESFQSPLRVLHIVPSLNRNAGVSKFVYNMHRYSDAQRVQFDYIDHQLYCGQPLIDNTYEEELLESGARVFHLENAGKDFRKFVRDCRNFFELYGSDYDVAHCHMPNSAFVTLAAAKRAGIKCRILHSHLNASSDIASHRVRNAPLIAWGKRYATASVACSLEAGAYLFGEKSFTVLNNGIPISKYAYSCNKESTARALFGIPKDCLVIGCVGRLVKQKNYHFMIDLMNAMLRLTKDVRLVIVGDGEMNNELVEHAQSNHVEDYVVFAGLRDDMENMYSMFDVFVMPSLYEGLPVSAVEAQAAGLRCVFSSNVPFEVDLTSENAFIPLAAPSSTWIEAILGSCKKGRVANAEALLSARGYSVEKNANELALFYESQIAL